MVTYTSTLIGAQSATLGGAQSATLDRYRPALSLSPMPASRVIDVEPRTISPVFARFMGGVRPDADQPRTVVGCDSRMTWHQDNTTTTVFGGGFASLDDIQTRVGPPPPRRPSV